jgi:hypothetical protein
MSIFIVTAEHWDAPGRQMTVHATMAGAERTAARYVNILRKDAKMEQDATATDWEEKLEPVLDLKGGAYCYVDITAQDEIAD